MKTTENTIPPTDTRKQKCPGSGGYRGLRTFPFATIICGATGAFRDRVVDQALLDMVLIYDTIFHE